MAACSAISPLNFVSTDSSPVRAWRATTAPPRDHYTANLLLITTNRLVINNYINGRFVSFRAERCGGFGAATAVALEHTRRREFAQLVSDHVFRDEQLR